VSPLTELRSALRWPSTFERSWLACD
jgi:hypothetical protein